MFFPNLRLKEKIACIYTTIYAPIEDKLDGLIGDMDDKIIFATELSLVNPNIGDELLLYMIELTQVFLMVLINRL